MNCNLRNILRKKLVILKTLTVTLHACHHSEAKSMVPRILCGQDHCNYYK